MFLKKGLKSTKHQPYRLSGRNIQRNKSRNVKSTTKNNKKIYKRWYCDPIKARGVRDFYPEDKLIKNWLFNIWHQISHRYGFLEYESPLLERVNLYERKSGEDIIKQLYTFQTDEGEQLALRPEITPSLTRMIMSKKELLFPLRWYSIQQCWRYEQMQRGRRREHFQWNMDIIGVPMISAEAELLSSLVDFFKSVGITSNDVMIKINSRKILGALLSDMKINELFLPVCIILDKLDKIGKEEVSKELIKLGIDNNSVSRIIEIISIKDIKKIQKYISNEEAVRDILDLYELLKAYDILDWIEFDPSIVRGLSYYTGIVFEGYDRKKQFRALCGGGRYDNLFSLYGLQQNIPAVGFGFGDCVIMELLEEMKKKPQLHTKIDDLILPYSEDLRPVACKVAQKLRAKGRSVDIQLIADKRIKWSYSYADRIKAERVIFIAPDEWNNQLVRIKDLRKETKEKEYTMKYEDL